MPCAVRKEGSVSQEANTDCESFTVDFRGELDKPEVPGIFNIFWAVMLGVSVVGVFAGTYMVTGGRWTLEERRRGPFAFVDHAAADWTAAKRSKHLIIAANIFCRNTVCSSVF